MKGLILAAGKGTRLRPITFSIPKPLVPIANKPTFMYAVESLICCGIKNIGIVINEEYRKEFEKVIDNYVKEKNIKINFIVQDEPKGIAHAILAAKEYIGAEPFIVQLADNIIFHDYLGFIKIFDRCKVLLASVDNISRYGIAEFKEGRISNLIEKPEKSESNLALVGLYIFTHEIFDFIEHLKPSSRGEYEITHAINNMLNQYGHLDYDICSRWWKDTGTPNDMLEANRFVLQTILKCDTLVNVTSELTDVKTDGYVSIGEQCKIINCNIKNSIVFNNVTIENVDIHDSIIGENCRINGINGNKSSISMILGNQSTLGFK